MKLFTSLFTFLLITCLATAQNVDTRRGKISNEEWNPEHCPYDIAAQAIILLDKGRIYFFCYSFLNGMRETKKMVGEAAVCTFSAN